MMEQKNKIEAISLLRIFLGLIFLSAGIYRIFNWQQALLEISSLNMPFAYIISVIVVILEIIGGLFLIFNTQTKKALVTLIIFLVFTLCWTVIISWKNLILNAGVLFVFKANPVDFFLHFTYLILLIYLLLEFRKQAKTKL